MATSTIPKTHSQIEITGTIGSKNQDQIVPYPAGYDVNNCYIANFEYLYNSIWRNITVFVTDTSSWPVMITLRSGGIYLYPVGNNAPGSQYRLLLARK